MMTSSDYAGRSAKFRSKISAGVLEAGPAFAKKLAGNGEHPAGKDDSRSAMTFRRMIELKAAGLSYDEAKAAVLSDPDPGIAEWASTKGLADGERELRRAYDNVGTKPKAGDDAGRGPTQAQILIDLAKGAELFHSADGTCFADVDINGHRETWKVRSKGFKRWIARGFYEKARGAPNSEAMQSAINVIEATAHFDAPERPVHIRVGGLGGCIYIDLGDETWRSIEIDATGWRVNDNPPVRFRRAAGMLPLPMPGRGASIEKLRDFLNVRSDADFVLAVAWLLACLRNKGPYPVLALAGEHGAAKSTFAAIMRSLIDPNTSPLRALPREDRDLFIGANNGHVLAFDNVSHLPTWISDTICRIATGGGFSARQLFSDDDEALFSAIRPVILNGIEDFITRPDLADRTLFLTLDPIPDEKRRPEETFWTEFEGVRPSILGALLDAVAYGINHLPATHLDRLPRMADFALWASACEPALWDAGTFWAAFCGNRDEMTENVLAADSVATAVRTLMATMPEFEGTTTKLLHKLEDVAGERIAKAKEWPTNAKALSGRLRRAAPLLRKIEIDVVFSRDGTARTVSILAGRK